MACTGTCTTLPNNSQRRSPTTCNTRVRVLEYHGNDQRLHHPREGVAALAALRVMSAQLASCQPALLCTTRVRNATHSARESTFLQSFSNVSHTRKPTSANVLHCHNIATRCARTQRPPHVCVPLCAGLCNLYRTATSVQTCAGTQRAARVHSSRTERAPHVKPLHTRAHHHTAAHCILLARE